ncbi:MAG: hypothetical protein ABI208_05950 [Ginsengibacter sp.]
MKRVSFLLFAFICLAGASAHAQSYKTAIGAKFYTGNGSLGGINVRHNMSANTALEGSLLFYNGGLGIEGLYEFQGPISGARGLNYFVGGGGLLGFSTGGNSQAIFALRLTGGIDYTFAEAPINVSLGFDPFFYVAPNTSSNLALGIGLRYTIQ